MDEIESPGLAPVGRDEALGLLQRTPIGRIVYTIRALPAVSPVNFILDHGSVVIRVGRGSKLAAAVRHSVVAFEADEVDPESHTGWSVTVTGRAELIRDPDEVAWMELHGPRPWAPGVRDHFVRIKPEIVTGRRLLGPAAPLHAAYEEAALEDGYGDAEQDAQPVAHDGIPTARPGAT